MLIRKDKGRKIYMGIASAFILIFIAVDYFGWFSFSMLLDWQMLDLLENTTGSETAGFFRTYVTPLSVAMLIGGLTLVWFAAWGLARLLGRYRRTVLCIAAVMALSGCMVYGQMVYGFVRFRNGESVPRLVSFTRLAYGKVLQHQRQKVQATLCAINAREVAEPTTIAEPDSVIVVFVLGESHSAFHTPAMGYDKDTQPLMSVRIAGADSLRTAVFTDAISSNDRTDFVMEAIFTLGGPAQYGKAPLFPAVFKRNGFSTTLQDNAFGTGGGASFMLNPELNNTLYDVRNDECYRSDEELLYGLPDSISAPALVILHLRGSHFPYAERYDTSRFSKFTAADYDATLYTEAQRAEIAHYDNSLLNTDAILNDIIGRVENKNAVVVYFSDHGEEVYELRDYAGHSCAASSPDPQYQLRVPMVVWASEKYATAYPGRMAALRANSGKEVMTDNTADLLLTLAGITDSRIDSTRSVATDRYIERPRTVLNSYQFDHVK